MSEQQNTNAETWRPVVGYEGLYEVSDLGRVKRIKAGPNTWAGRILRQNLMRIGYYQCVLTSPGPVQKQHYVHRLVAAAFLGPADGLEVNHKNGDKADNRLENLEYVTRAGNVRHAIDTGLTPIGDDSPRSKLRAAMVLAIRSVYCPRRAKLGIGPTAAAIGKCLGVSPAVVVGAASGKGWTHIGENETPDPAVVDELKNRLAALPSSTRKVRKLSVDDVREIRRLRQEGGVSYSQLMRRFGVSRSMIHDVVKRNSFTHVE